MDIPRGDPDGLHSGISRDIPVRILEETLKESWDKSLKDSREKSMKKSMKKHWGASLEKFFKES